MSHGSEDVEAFANNVVAPLYAETYAKHSTWRGSLTGVLQDLQASVLAKRTKERFPTQEQVLVTLLNVNWVMQYWCAHNNCVATPTAGENGYTERNRQIHFSDTISSDA